MSDLLFQIIQYTYLYTYVDIMYLTVNLQILKEIAFFLNFKHVPTAAKNVNSKNTQCNNIFIIQKPSVPYFAHHTILEVLITGSHSPPKKQGECALTWLWSKFIIKNFEMFIFSRFESFHSRI